MPTTGPVKVTTLRSFIKEQTKLRVEKAAVEELARRMNERIGKVVDRAKVLVEMQDESTIQLDDVQRALAWVDRRRAAGQAKTPKEVFDLLEGYSIEQLSDLARRIGKSLED